MKKINIKRGDIQAVILPDYGGMVSELSVANRRVLRMFYDKLGLSNVLSGGIPLMFPFPSRCLDDEAVFEGQTYPMPMHGIVKELPFVETDVTSSACRLEIESSCHTLRHYPYEFMLAVEYAIVENAFKTLLEVENRSDRSMPFVLGTHPYFFSSDKQKTDFSFGLTEFDCYLEPEIRHGKVQGPLLMADNHDTVFWNGSPICDFTNHADGYRLHIEPDESFNVVTICTWQEKAICIEPWQGKPTAANHPEQCLWLEPGQSRCFSYDIALEAL